MKAVRLPTQLGSSLLGIGLLLSGCQWVFGDFEMATSASGDVATGGTPGTVGTICTSTDTYRCTGTIVESCTLGTWQPLANCSSDELCDAETGGCLECVPGHDRCTSFRLETCMASGGNWAVTEECETVDYCDASSGGCLTCLTDEAFCSGANLYVCNAAHTGWDTTTCDSADLCNARTRDCRPCVEGEYVCNDAVLQRCDAAQHWVTLDTCATAALCQDSLVQAAATSSTFDGQCVPPGCSAGTYQCNPSNKAELQGCPPSLRDWTTLSDCRTSALCNATTGKCDAGCGADPGSYRCTGAQLQRCRLDGTAWEVVETCPNAAYCNATKQDCVPCVAGETHCNGALLETCSSEQIWAKGQTCLSAALCDAKNGKCLAAGCEPAGTYRCDGAQLQQCATDYTAWKNVGTAACATAALCDAANGKCVDPDCKAGDSRCVNGSYQTCDAATRRWSSPIVCGENQLCTVGSGCLGNCPAAKWQCNSTGTNSVTLEECSVNPLDQSIAWKSRASCLSSALCANLLADCLDSSGCSLTPTSCTPACSPSESKCSGASLMTCNEGLTSWNTQTCASESLCDAAASTCDVCLADQYGCSGATLQRCNSAGSGLLSETADCKTADACYVGSSGTSGGCHTCSTEDAVQCSADGTRRQTCVTTLGIRSWEDQVCPCSNGACVACNGDSDCGAQVCNTSTHSCVECVTDGNCTGALKACDTSSGTCVGCTDDGDCGGATPACNLLTQTCVGCTERTDCAGSTPVCDSGTYTCVQCVARADCPVVTDFCVSNLCVACQNNGDCSSPTPDCIAGTCQACNGAAGCTTGYACNSSSGLCEAATDPDAGTVTDGGT